MARGGYRPGAGRKKGTTKATTKKERTIPSIPQDIVEEAEAENLDPLAYMLKVMNDPYVDDARRDRMAVSAAPFCHARKGEGLGKKEEKDAKAKSAGQGRFAPSGPPKLVAVK